MTAITTGKLVTAPFLTHREADDLAVDLSKYTFSHNVIAEPCSSSWKQKLCYGAGILVAGSLVSSVAYIVVAFLGGNKGALHSSVNTQGDFQNSISGNGSMPGDSIKHGEASLDRKLADLQNHVITAINSGREKFEDIPTMGDVINVMRKDAKFRSFQKRFIAEVDSWGDKVNTSRAKKRIDVTFELLDTMDSVKKMLDRIDFGTESGRHGCLLANYKILSDMMKKGGQPTNNFLRCP
ncbi:hypothetical protein SC171_21990 [Pantoea cypripedii]|uniref:hypothetical protein n=1 Tax=Pantoea cypripedii TaxID=55209 RepID=UPI002FCC5B4A